MVGAGSSLRLSVTSPLIANCFIRCKPCPTTPEALENRAVNHTSPYLEQHTFIVFNCEPALASLDGPLTELRETCNLVQFVLHIRQQFKDLLLASPPSSEPVKTSDEHRDAVADP
ncbi:hypothetical protein HPB50_026976 [Hyalomma asiaticum]|uniref:Uncharacterized protein n=1 Tax=Hyalomma asiaticum TaxID=266040 RepID=A0ACB7T2M1_HYAAI|nr:hypothetical protein HPB50_026976 [Hyalomma asiaticum]